MNTELYPKLFRAIFSEDLVASKEIAFEIMKAESEKSRSDTASDFTFKNNCAELPLGTFIPRERLRHHVILPDETEKHLLSIKQEYAARERLGQYNLSPKKKILFYGNLGCGKTLCAERIAWDLGLPLLKVRFNSFASSVFKESVSNLKAIFDYCKKQPVVLLLKECDFTAEACLSERSKDEILRIVNELYGLLDEYDAPGLVIATTSFNKSSFDEDEVLCQRFDDIVSIPAPKTAERKRLLKTTLSAIPVSSEVDIDKIANKLICCSAAEIISTALRAAKISVLAGSKKICKEHFAQALEESPDF